MGRTVEDLGTTCVQDAIKWGTMKFVVKPNYQVMLPAVNHRAVARSSSFNPEGEVDSPAEVTSTEEVTNEVEAEVKGPEVEGEA